MTLQVFISYKSEYRDFARAVKSELNQWGFDTWLDVDNIQPGDYFRHKIQQGLDSSDVLLMVLTEEAQLSREVMSEVDYFLDVAKKPVVPLRHRECKPLYIFVSIQYIDFVTDQANGFVQLKQRLNELASSVQQVPSAIDDILVMPQKPGAAAFPDAIGGGMAIEEQGDTSVFGGPVVTPEPEPAEAEENAPTREEPIQQETEKKEAILDHWLSVPAPLEPASQAPPKPQPVPPQPIIQPSYGAPVSQPASPVFQPQRQPETMPQPASRRKASPILWPLAAVAGLVIIVGAVALFSSSANISLAIPQQPEGISPLLWVAVLAIVGAAGVFGWRWFGRPKTSAVPSSSPIEDAKNRATMLQNVEDFWLKGVLDPALEAGTLDIGLSAAPGAVLRHKDYGDYALPPNANILNVFNDLNRELLILGAPGGGKTVLLLQLARELIAQARQDASKAVPVVFNLSSWAAEHKPLAHWLVDELRQKHQVPKKVATEWVEGEKLLLLLDGLDEVAEQYRNECVDAINLFRQQYRTVDLAICSRNEEYDALTSKLDVRGAIVLEPLSESIINAYLDRPELASLRQIMASDAELQEMSEVPFLLNAMAYAYAGATPTNLQFPASDDPAKTRRTHLFDRWVEKRLAVRSSADYIPRKVRWWLGWLAKKLRDFKQTTFYVEGLQPEWFQKQRMQFVYQVVLGLMLGLYLGVPFSVFLNQATILSFCILVGFIIGIYTGTNKISVPETIKWGFNLKTFTIAFLGGIQLVVVMLIIILSSQHTMENIVRDLGLNNLNIFGLSPASSLTFLISVFIIISSIVIGIISGLTNGINTVENINSRVSPNQGIWQSVKNLIRIWLQTILFIGDGFMLGGIILFGFNGNFLIGLTTGLIFGVILGWMVGYINTFTIVYTLLKHLVLRLVVWQSGDAPWNYARFLDYCASTGLMRKVGGGYIFAHRYLMDYFAETEVK